jgi:hypothetical protein
MNFKSWQASHKNGGLTFHVAVAVLGLTLAAGLLLVVAFIQRLSVGKSLGLMLPVSSAVILGAIGVCLFFYLYIKGNNFTVRVVTWKRDVLSHPRTAAIGLVILSEVALAAIAIIVWLNLKLLGPAYFGILPAFAWLFGVTLVLLINLGRFHSVSRNLLMELKVISLRNAVLMGMWLAWITWMAWLASRPVMALLLARVAFLAGKTTLQVILQILIIVLLVDLATLVICLLPWKNGWLGAVPATDQPEKSKRSKLVDVLVSLVLAIGAYIVLLVILHPAYEVHDDLLMSLMVSGYYGTEKVVFPIFSNFLLGFLYKPLFAWKPEINWVVWFYYLADFFALWGLLFTILSTRVKQLHKIFGITLALLFCTYPLISISFTTTAALCSLAGAMLIFSRVIDGDGAGVGRVVFGSSLLVIANLIRFDGSILGLLVVVPALLVNFRRYSFRRLVFNFLPAAMLMFGGYAAQQINLHHNAAVKAYVDLLALRSEIRDTPRLLNLRDEILPLYDNGFSMVDMESFFLSVYIDDNVFSAERIETLKEIISDKRSSINETEDAFFALLDLKYVLSFIYLGITAWAWMLLATRSRRVIFTSLLAGGIMNGLLLYLFLWHKLPSRLFGPLVTAFSLLTWLLVAWFEGSRNQKLSGALDTFGSKWAAVIFLFFFAFAVAGIITQTEAISQKRMADQAVVTSINVRLDELVERGEIGEDAIVYMLGGRYYTDVMNPLQFDLPKSKLVIVGWVTSSPVLSNFMASRGVETIGKALYEDPNSYILADAGLSGLLKAFIQQHYSVEVITTPPVYLCPPTDDKDAACRYTLFQLVEKPGQ